MNEPQQYRKQPVSPTEAAHTLWLIGEDIDRHTEELIRLRREQLEAQRKFRRVFAASILRGSGSVEDRRRTAEQESDQAWFDMEAKGQEVEACKDRLKALRDRSEIGRVLNANLKEELRMTGSTS